MSETPETASQETLDCFIPGSHRLKTILSKKERVKEFLSRLSTAPAANSYTEALKLMHKTMKGVEDKYKPRTETRMRTPRQFDPTTLMHFIRKYKKQLGRDKKQDLYPIPASFDHSSLPARVEKHPELTCYAQIGHLCIVGNNGSIQIYAYPENDPELAEYSLELLKNSKLLFNKPGADGKSALEFNTLDYTA